MVLMLEGINDIGYSQTTPAEAVTSEQIIEAYRQLIARSHAHGIAIVAATITPFEDSHYYDLHGEQMRQEVNHWIRTSGALTASSTSMPYYAIQRIRHRCSRRCIAAIICIRTMRATPRWATRST